MGVERLLREAVVDQGGPADWALPYWNYFGTDEQDLPAAFASADWPDGQGDNPLFVAQRWGDGSGGGISISLSEVNLNAMDDVPFKGIATGGNPGFRGPETGFWPGGGSSGGVESQPHKIVHTLVGGSEPGTGIPGLMSYPPTAGLDPIFYLHHANIDRLWSSWLRDASHNNPTEANWLKGPVNSGQRGFAMPNADGSQWDYTPEEMVDTLALGYEYDDLTPVAAAAPVLVAAAARVARLGAPADVQAAAETRVQMATTESDAEMIGANDTAVPLGEGVTHAPVRLANTGRMRVAASLNEAARGAAPDRVYLNLENVSGLSDAVAFRVYVGMPSDGDPADHPENLAGTVSLFGLSRASDENDLHAGSGLTLTVEITEVVDRLHLGGTFDADDLSVHMVPITPVPAAAQIKIGRISIYREAG